MPAPGAAARTSGDAQGLRACRGGPPTESEPHVSSDKVESLTAAAARIRELEDQLAEAANTNAALRNILTMPSVLGPELLKPDAEHAITDPMLRSWLAALPDALESLPPVVHGLRPSKGALPS